ncbi:MAG: hypothetical protein V4655_14405 [Bdellovibrionota bacterium]
MQKRIICSLLLFSMTLQSACIHTVSEERVSIEILALDKLGSTGASKDSLRIEHLVYTPSKLPLEDFFDRLMAGEFQESFRRINLLYTPATSDDKVLQNLLSVGMIPVYVRMENKDTRPYIFNEGDFTLDDGAQRLKAIPAAQLPKALKKFHVGAVGANIYNTGVVVLVVAGIMAVMAIAARGQVGNIPTGNSLVNSEPETRIYNATTKTTHLDYKNYLLTARTIAPGESGQGLLFFRAGNTFDNGNIRFRFKDSSEGNPEP